MQINIIDYCFIYKFSFNYRSVDVALKVNIDGNIDVDVKVLYKKGYARLMDGGWEGEGFWTYIYGGGGQWMMEVEGR